MQSDLYALGLVLYKVFSGRPAWQASTIAEMSRLHSERTPTKLTSLVTDLDPLVDLIVFQCLPKDPAQRPSSALAVSAALPGGDPLAAALARGETPSPEAVASAGQVVAIQPAVALACLAAIIGALAVVVALSAQTQLTRIVPLEKSPAVLTQQGRDAIARWDTRRPRRMPRQGFLRRGTWGGTRQSPARSLAANRSTSAPSNRPATAPLRPGRSRPRQRNRHRRQPALPKHQRQHEEQQDEGDANEHSGARGAQDRRRGKTKTFQRGPVGAAVALVPYLLITVVLLRFGLLPLVVSAVINPLLDHSPLTMDAASWYAPNSWLVLAFVTGLAVYAFRVALAGRPMLSGAFFNE